MPVRRDELHRWARVAFLGAYPFWTLYKIIHHHYLLWLHSTCRQTVRITDFARLPGRLWG